MTFTPKLLEQYRECEKALQEAERLLQDESSSAARLSELEKLLSTDNNAMAMIRKHREYGQRLPVVLGKLGDYKSKPQFEIANTIEPVSDAEMIEGNWAQCVAGCKAKSLEVATARQIAELRIKHGKDSDYCTKGRWACEGAIYVSDGRLIITPMEFNPLIANAEEAVKAHASTPFSEYYIENSVLTRQLLSASLVLERDKIPQNISTKDFGKEPVTSYIGWGREYADLLEYSGITSITFYTCGQDYAKKQKQAFSRALWAGNLSLNSALDGINLLNYYGDGRVSGVRRRGESSGTGSTGPR